MAPRPSPRAGPRLRSPLVEAGRTRRVLVGVLVGALLAGLGVGAADLLGAFSGLTPAQRAARARARERAAEQRVVRRAEKLVAVRIPRHPGRPAPVAVGALFRTPHDSPHEVIGYAPYWTMAQLTAADFRDVSTLCYFGPTVGPSGELVRKGLGWADLSGTRFIRLVTSAHAAGDRVLLTVSNSTPGEIAALLAHPAAHAARLANELVPLLSADHLDGVSLDIEGRDPSERRRFVAFVAAFSRSLHRADPGGELVLDTYPQSAGSSSDFFDVKALARHVDRLFVMGYDMEDATTASPNAPLFSPSLGPSDVKAVLAYKKAVSPKKIVLGVPFYGVDFTTGAPRHKDHAAHDPPVAVTYASIASAAHPARWDPHSYTPYAKFRAKGATHETWYDDPVSIALKTALAETEGLAGTGVWCLGDEGGASAMVAALDGGGPPAKLPLLPGPSPAAVAAARSASRADAGPAASR